MAESFRPAFNQAMRKEGKMEVVGGGLGAGAFFPALAALGFGAGGMVRSTTSRGRCV